MKKCILCGKEHVNGCDKSEWDGVLKQKFNVSTVEEINVEWSEQEKNAIAKNIQSIADHIDNEALREIERQHVNKKRGRPRRA